VRALARNLEQNDSLPRRWGDAIQQKNDFLKGDCTIWMSVLGLTFGGSLSALKKPEK
jgi:hypothetical protein